MEPERPLTSPQDSVARSTVMKEAKKTRSSVYYTHAYTRMLMLEIQLTEHWNKACPFIFEEKWVE